MNLRKWIRIIHRDAGYIFFGMSVIYGLSGIALNHIDDWNPNYIIRTKQIIIDRPPQPESISEKWIIIFLNDLDRELQYRNHYFPQDNLLKIFLKQGSLTINLASGNGVLETIKRRPIFREVNFLHYNKPKKLWTWFADLFAVALILLAITGLFMIKGKKGITGRGAWLTSLGIVIPLLFLIIYLW
ncbi:MAG: hypothetical protein AMS27_18175 [Bacteroides sp. SM23_62_1]|nr:MAG: hypothetical protein AMS27_18175 [Bacteroides sp. SM23_62_1]